MPQYLHRKCPPSQDMSGHVRSMIGTEDIENFTLLVEPTVYSITKDGNPWEQQKDAHKLQLISLFRTFYYF